jgi:ubiquinone/menaquinone biosynthesis C-methylase UbiE
LRCPKEIEISHTSTQKTLGDCAKILVSFNIKAEKVLDIGCGTGESTRVVAKAVGAENVFGVDFSEGALTQAINKGIDVRKVDMNWEPLPFPNDFFDFVSAIEVIEHLINPDNMFEEVWRVLKCGGFFFLTTPNLASWVNRFLILLGYMPVYSEPSLKYRAGCLARNKIIQTPALHLRLYTLKSLKELAQFYKFKVINAFGFKGHEYNAPSVINVLDRIIGRSGLASHVGILAEKKMDDK